MYNIPKIILISLVVVLCATAIVASWPYLYFTFYLSRSGNALWDNPELVKKICENESDVEILKGEKYPPSSVRQCGKYLGIEVSGIISKDGNKVHVAMSTPTLLIDKNKKFIEKCGQIGPPLPFSPCNIECGDNNLCGAFQK